MNRHSELENKRNKKKQTKKTAGPPYLFQTPGLGNLKGWQTPSDPIVSGPVRRRKQKEVGKRKHTRTHITLEW